MNMLLSKGISNIYLKVTFEKKWRTQNFDFRNLKVCLQVSFWGARTHAEIIEFLNFFASRSKTVCGFSIIFILKGIMTI